MHRYGTFEFLQFGNSRCVYGSMTLCKPRNWPLHVLRSFTSFQAHLSQAVALFCAVFGIEHNNVFCSVKPDGLFAAARIARVVNTATSSADSEDIDRLW